MRIRIKIKFKFKMKMKRGWGALARSGPKTQGLDRLNVKHSMTL